jgi:secreted trypsin-like serine protease
MFCAGDRGKNPCKGDSGSGWYVNVNNAYHIIGIVSSAARAECETNKYVIFTSVPMFLEWIEEYVDKRTSTCRRRVTCTIEDDHE